jgi:hypothetical protein
MNILYIRMPKNKQKKDDRSSTFPKKIYIIRHGEKPDEDSHDLSIQGVARAHYLTDYWVNQHVPNPDIIYCFKKNGTENRSDQLMVPLSYKYNIPINSNYTDKKDEDKLVEDVLSNNADKIVLICWEHNNIPLIVKLIYDKLSKKNVMNTAFQYWSTDPKNGVSGGKNDSSLYSLTLLIDTESLVLTGSNQSDNFMDDVLLAEVPINTLFTING